MMGIVVEDVHLPVGQGGRAQGLEAAQGASKCLRTPQQVVCGQPQESSGHEGGCRIPQVVAPRHRQAQGVLMALEMQGGRGVHAGELDVGQTCVGVVGLPVGGDRGSRREAPQFSGEFPGPGVVRIDHDVADGGSGREALEPARIVLGAAPVIEMIGLHIGDHRDPGGVLQE